MKNESGGEMGEVVVGAVVDGIHSQAEVVVHMNLAAGNCKLNTGVGTKGGTWGIVVDRMADEAHTVGLLDYPVG